MPSSPKVKEYYGTDTFEAWLEYTISSPNPAGTVAIQWTLKGQMLTTASGPGPIKTGHSGNLSGTVNSSGVFSWTRTDLPATEEILELYNYKYAGISKRIVAVVRIQTEDTTYPKIEQEVRVFMRREYDNGYVLVNWVVESGSYSATEIIRPKVERA